MLVIIGWCKKDWFNVPFLLKFPAGCVIRDRRAGVYLDTPVVVHIVGQCVDRCVSDISGIDGGHVRAETRVCAVLQTVVLSTAHRSPAECGGKGGIGIVRWLEQGGQQAIPGGERLFSAGGTVSIASVHRNNAPVINTVGQFILRLMGSGQGCLVDHRGPPATRSGIDLELVPGGAGHRGPGEGGAVIEIQGTAIHRVQQRRQVT